MLSQCDGKPSISRCLDHASMLDRAIARSQVKLIEHRADEGAKSPDPSNFKGAMSCATIADGIAGAI
jgi:hypothetical protein